MDEDVATTDFLQKEAIDSMIEKAGIVPGDNPHAVKHEA